MSLRIAARSSATVSITRRIAASVALIAVGYVAALVASPSIQLPLGVGPSHGAAANQAAERSAAPASATANLAAPRDFDYFPDHYQNEAREPSQPADTF